MAFVMADVVRTMVDSPIPLMLCSPVRSML